MPASRTRRLRVRSWRIWNKRHRSVRLCDCRSRVRRRMDGFDGARAGFVKTNDSAWMPVRVRDGQGGLRPVARATAVVRRKRPANGDGSGPGAAGSRGFRGNDAGLMAGSWVDSHEIRGLCFLYPDLQWLPSGEMLTVLIQWSRLTSYVPAGAGKRRNNKGG